MAKRKKTRGPGPSGQGAGSRPGGAGGKPGKPAGTAGKPRGAVGKLGGAAGKPDDKRAGGPAPPAPAPALPSPAPVVRTAPVVVESPPPERAGTGAGSRKSARRAPAQPSRDPAPPPAGFGFPLEMSSAKLAVARFAIFAVLAVDAVLQIAHASRYGAGDFNVAHFSFVPGPGRQLYLLAQCSIACLSLLVALGAGGRLPAIALSVAYGWCYFGSQLDSFQHHYLAWLLITLWCFVPPPAALGRARAAPWVRSSALRLILLQLGIMYLWAALSKIDPKWLDGTAMSMQIRGPLREAIDATLGIKIVSRLVIVSELALAITIWRAQTWRWALLLGIGLHFMIALSGLEIGVFAYLMLAIYLLVVPESIAQPAIAFVRNRIPARLASRMAAAFNEGHRPTAAALSLVALLLLFVIRPPLRNPLVMAFAAVPMILTVRWQLESARRFTTRAALAAALAMLTFVVVDRAAAVAIDYYRYWGGSARRLGKPAEAEAAYRGLLAIEPRLELGHYQLGRLLVKRGAVEDGLAHLRLAEQLEPRRARALDEIARVLAASGRQEEAKLAAQRAKQRRDAEASAAGQSGAPSGSGSGSAIPSVPAPADGHRDDGGGAAERDRRGDDRDDETTL